MSSHCDTIHCEIKRWWVSHARARARAQTHKHTQTHIKSGALRQVDTFSPSFRSPCL